MRRLIPIILFFIFTALANGQAKKFTTVWKLPLWLSHRDTIAAGSVTNTQPSGVDTARKNSLNYLSLRMDSILTALAEVYQPLALPHKNLFNRANVTEGYNINNQDHVLRADTASIVSGFCPVDPATAYVLFDPFYQPYIHYYDASGNYISNSGTNTYTFTTPAGCYYVRFNVVYHGVPSEWPAEWPAEWPVIENTVQLEIGSTTTTYEHYETALMSDLSVPDSFAVNTITIANSSKIVLMGDSYTESYMCTKGKAWGSYLSMFTDWNVENYSMSGWSTADMLTAIQSNTKLYGSAYGIQDYNGTYGLICLYTNDVNEGIINGSVLLADYVTNLRKLIVACRGMGMTPVLCDEYHNTNGSNSALLQASVSMLAQDMGVQYFTILDKTSIFNSTHFHSYWLDSHPGIRTNGLFWASMKRYIDALPRPRQGIKIFRHRTSFTVSTVQDLYYQTPEDRAKRFKEIYVGQKGLSAGQEKYFDDLDTLNSIGSSPSNYCEYLQLRNKTLTAIADYGLFEIVVPSASNKITTAELFVKLATAPDSAYVRNLLSGQWVSTGFHLIAGGGTWYSIPILKPQQYIEGDKIAIMLYKSTGSVTLSDIYLQWAGAESKSYVSQHPLPSELTTTELLTKTTVAAADTASWTKVGSIVPITPSDSVLPSGITKEVLITNTAYISQGVTFSALTTRAQRLQIKAWVRYNPAKFNYTDSYPANSWQSEDTYDFADLTVKVAKNAGNVAVVVEPVALHWHEVLIEVLVPNGESSWTITFQSADTKGIEFCYASVKVSG